MKYLSILMFSLLVIATSCGDAETHEDAEQATEITNSESAAAASAETPTELTPLATKIQGNWGAVLQTRTGLDSLNIDFEIQVNGYNILTRSTDKTNGTLEVEENFITVGDTLKRHRMIEGTRYDSEEHIIVDEVTDSTLVVQVIARDASTRLKLFKR